MSKVFYDHLISLDELDDLIKMSVENADEREELWKLVDEIVHHRIIGFVVSHLPKEFHLEFLEKLHKHPYDSKLIDYLSDKVNKNMEELIKQEIGNISFEIIQEIKK